MAIQGRFKVKAVLVLGLALLSCVAEGARRGLADTGATVFDVTQYGAKADDKTDNLAAFMKTWVAACKSGGAAKVLIPAQTFLTGPVLFAGPCQGPITIEVLGTVKATTDISAYTENQWFGFEHIDGLLINGGGTFDGQGGQFWKYNDCQKNSHCQLLPSSLHFSQVSNAEITGINSVNSMAFHLHVHGCNNLKVDSLHITAPGDSPNTDGIHISSSNLVNVTNTIIGTGDDCVSIGQGATNIGITKVTCGPGHGISIGSLGKYKNEKDVSGIYVKDCTLSQTTNGLRIKTWSDSTPSLASSIVFEDITLDTVKNPIIIDQKYGSKSSPSSTSRVKISDVHFKNIRGTSTSAVAVSLLCSSLFPCESLELTDIDLTYVGAKTGLPLTSSCLNTKATFGGTQNPPACK